MSGPLYDSKLATWRSQFSPIANLTIGRYVQMMVNAEMGYYSDRSWLFRFVEQRDYMLKAVLERRLSAIHKLDWSIKIKKGKEGKQAEDQKQFLHEQYELIDNLREAIEFLALASFRGFSHLEKHYTGDGDVFHLQPVPQWHWSRKLPSLDWLLNLRAFQTATGIPIEEEDFVIREIDRPIDIIASLAFIRKGLGQKDYDGWIETFGIPAMFITLPPGVGGATSVSGPGGEPLPGSLDHYMQISESVISNGRGVLPNGATITAPMASVNQRSPFSDYIRSLDEQICLAGTSGLLGSLTANTGLGGGGTGQAESHDDAFMSIAKSEALAISEILQKQFDAKLLNDEFKSQDILVYFDLAHDDVADRDIIKDASALSTAGYQIDLAELSERTGYTLTLKAQPGAPGAPFGAGAGTGADPSVDATGEGAPDNEDDPSATLGDDTYSDWVGNRSPDIDRIMNAARRALRTDVTNVDVDELERAVVGTK